MSQSVRPVLAALLMGCLPLADAKESSGAAKPTDPPFLAEAKTAVRDVLRDPESAQFKSVALRTGLHLDMKFQAACGEVNAKNAYGGYAGFKRFVAFQVANYDLDVRLESDHRFASAWSDYCLPKPQ